MLAGFSLRDLEQHRPAPVFTGNEESYWTALREQFPLSKSITYLNNGSLGPSPYPVITATHKWMMEADEYVNYNVQDSSIKKIAEFTGAHEDEIALTGNTTHGINIACWGVPMRKGDEVILTTHEHAGGALPWLNRQKLHGIRVRTFHPAPTAAETLDRIASVITKRTRVIAVPHILCTQGQVLPLKEICRLGKDKGLFVLIDGAHGPGMMPVDLHDAGCDAYAGCFHKWMLGPKGAGFLYVRKDFQDTLQPLFAGAGSDDAKWNMAIPSPAITGYYPSAHRYYNGTSNIGIYKGAEASIDFIHSIGSERVYERITALGNYMHDNLLNTDRIEMLTPVEAGSRCGMTGFRIKGIQFDQFYTRALEQDIRIRVMPENNLNSLRVSTHIYNSREEIDRLIALIKKTAP